MSATVELTASLIKGKLTDMMVPRGAVADVDTLTPGVYYINSATLNVPQGFAGNGIMEVSAAASTLVQQKIFERGGLNPKLYMRIYWLTGWGSWVSFSGTVMT